MLREPHGKVGKPGMEEEGSCGDREFVYWRKEGMEREMGKKKMIGEGKDHLMFDALSFFSGVLLLLLVKKSTS